VKGAAPHHPRRLSIREMRRRPVERREASMETSRRSRSRPYGERWAPRRVWTLRLVALLVGLGSLLAGLAMTSGDLVDVVVGIVLMVGLLLELAVARHQLRSGG